MTKQPLLFDEPLIRTKIYKWLSCPDRYKDCEWEELMWLINLCIKRKIEKFAEEIKYTDKVFTDVYMGTVNKRIDQALASLKSQTEGK